MAVPSHDNLEATPLDRPTCLDEENRIYGLDPERYDEDDCAGPIPHPIPIHEEPAMSQELRSRLEAALGSLPGIPCSRCLALNSIKLSFGSGSDPQGERYLWIEPPWRMTVGGRFVMGSQDCPDHEDFEVEQEYSEAFDEWAAPFKGWGAAAISEFHLGHPVPDLSLGFSSGQTIETFNRSGKQYSWYYREVASGLVIEAYASGIADG